jgi:adenosylcobinamide-GDP ribazoletransferase
MRLAARALRAGVAFLTRLPVGGHPFTASEQAWAPAFFPLVGLALGAALSVLHRWLWPLGPLADATLVVGASLLVSGALHEDGLADTCDALGGAMDRERVFEILKDSRVGVFGACAVTMSILARVALLDRLGTAASWSLPVAHCTARLAPVWQMARQPYVTRTGAKSAGFVQAAVPQAIVASIWPAVFACALVVAEGGSIPRLALRLVASFAVVALVGAATSHLYERRAGGVTGDFLGATEQLCEVACLLALAWNLSPSYPLSSE